MLNKRYEVGDNAIKQFSYLRGREVVYNKERHRILNFRPRKDLRNQLVQFPI